MAMAAGYSHCLPKTLDALAHPSLTHLDGKDSHPLSDPNFNDANTEMFRRSSTRPDMDFHDPNGPPPYQGSLFDDIKTIFSPSTSKPKANTKGEKSQVLKAPEGNWIDSLRKSLSGKANRAQGSKRPGAEVEMQEVTRFGKRR